MSSQQLFLDQVYTVGDKTLTGEEIRDRLVMFDKLSAFVESEHARLGGE
jgi:hypothetical protein